MTSHVRTTIRYDGPALAGHEMDVQDLAPALLALADIIQTANRKFNGDATTMRVLVKADVEQKCFQIDLSLVQSVIERAKALFESDGIKTAEEIAKFIGIVGSGAVGLFKLLKWLTKKGDESSTKIEINAAAGSTVLLVKGDGSSIVVPREVYNLASDVSVIEKAKNVVAPLARDGYETLSFVENDVTVDTVTKKEANEFTSTPEILAPSLNDSVSVIHGPVRIKSPQYEGNAKWTVMWGGKAIDVTMPADWVRQFQNNTIVAPPGTTLDVQMEQKVQLDEKGNAVGAISYTVMSIHNVILPQPPSKQSDLLDI